MRARLVLLSIIFFLLYAPSRAQNDDAALATLSDITAVSMFVEPLAEELSDKGINQFVLSVELERCLKDAGIAVLNPGQTDPVEGTPTLYLAVDALADDNVDQWTFAVQLELTQPVRLERMPELEGVIATTWSTGGIGVYGRGWRESLIREVASYVDEFAQAYLAVNPDLED